MIAGMCCTLVFCGEWVKCDRQRLRTKLRLSVYRNHCNPGCAAIAALKEAAPSRKTDALTPDIPMLTRGVHRSGSLRSVLLPKYVMHIYNKVERTLSLLCEPACDAAGGDILITASVLTGRTRGIHTWPPLSVRCENGLGDLRMTHCAGAG